MPDEQNIDAVEAWKKSRSGAWAGRGFHYQHLFSTLILIRQWAGLAPSGALVPEGLEDCVVEVPNQELWIQIKSRKDGTFSEAEVQKVLAGVNGKADSVEKIVKRKTIVVLEQQCLNLNSIGVDRLFENTEEQILVCSSPRDQIVAILTEQLNTAEIIAEGVLSDLYQLVASASEENASLSFDDRRRISTSEIERRIFERLEAEDPSAIDRALASGTLAPVDFSKPISEPAFYQGIKVTPGHVAAGLVFNRPIDRENVTRLLKQRRHVLISGPSGAGKSALLWSSVESLIGDIRWYQITSRAIVADADAIIRFLRARRPTESSPIGIAFDEIGSTNADLWDVLVRELRNIPPVYFLGAVRKEDTSLISNHADIEFVEVSLNENLAKSVWLKLHTEGQTDWEHWREPFEQSDGLMLEYVHILTQGKRLSLVIDDQIRIRQQEGRRDELAILRITSVLCASGGDVQADKLISFLDINPDSASRALTRLVDEHLIREDRPGVLGGLHMLRSKALVNACHDQVVFLSADSLWQGLLAVTNDTLPRVIQSILADLSGVDEVSTLNNLWNILNNTQDAEVWSSILTGLGLATLERNVVSFTGILEQYGVQRAQWALASMFSDPQIDIIDFNEFEQWKTLCNAVLAFRALPKKDLRKICLEKRSKELSVPTCISLQQANKLFSSIAPICGGNPIDINISPEFLGNCELDINDVSDFLSSAYFISPDLAKQLVNELGGEETLFDWFVSQTPWVSFPKIDASGKHGRTVRSDVFYVSEKEQTDPHKSICDICETLISISPDSEAAASDTVTPLGQPITVGEYRPWSKNMPRQNIPSKTRVSWNVAFRQILLARSASDSLTNYTHTMADLVQRTEKVFRLYSEKWIKRKRIANADAIAQEVNDIIQSVNAIAFASPENPSHEMTKPSANAGQEDSIGALLTGILGNLMGRMGNISGDGNPKATAAFAGELAGQAYEHEQSLIWRTSLSPPQKELKALAGRLIHVSHLLHEFAYDNSDVSVHKIIKSSKKSNPGKAVSTAARRCQLFAKQRFDKKLHSLEKDLSKRGWNCKCWSRPVDETDSVYWPSAEVAIAVDIKDFETDAEYMEAAFTLADHHFANNWRYRIVPVINSFVVAPLAMLPSSHSPLPDLDFTEDWKDYIEGHFISSPIANYFDKALDACVQASAVIACCDLDRLHPVEDKVISDAIETFSQNRELLLNASEKSDDEHILWACDFIEQYWDKVVDEFEAAKIGKKIECPICEIPYQALSGEPNEQVMELAGARILMLQAECYRLAQC